MWYSLSINISVSMSAMYPRMKASSATDAVEPGPTGIFKRKAITRNVDMNAAGILRSDILPLRGVCRASDSCFSNGVWGGGSLLRGGAKTREKSKRMARMSTRRATTLASTIHRSLTYFRCWMALRAICASVGLLLRATIVKIGIVEAIENGRVSNG